MRSIDFSLSFGELLERNRVDTNEELPPEAFSAHITRQASVIGNAGVIAAMRLSNGSLVVYDDSAATVLRYFGPERKRVRGLTDAAAVVVGELRRMERAYPDAEFLLSERRKCRGS